MRLILVRHSETHMNKDGLILGLNGPSLNSTGITQARRVALALSPERPFVLYSSPITRAIETAQAISQVNDVPIITLSELGEMDAGKLEGLSGEEARRLYPDVMGRWAKDPSTVVMPGGESLLMVQQRAWKAVQKMSECRQSEKAVAVTHNFVILSILCKTLSLPLGSFRRFKLDLGAITTIDVDGENAAIISVNQRCHLAELTH